MRFYPLGDTLTPDEYRSLGLPTTGFHHKHAKCVKAVSTGEKRCPKKGERYLSGAKPAAYLAYGDLSTEYGIARLVKTETTTTTRIIP